MKLIEVKLKAKPKSLQPIPPCHFSRTLPFNEYTLPSKTSAFTVAIAMNHKGTDFLPHT